MPVIIDTLIAPLIVGFLMLLYFFGNEVSHSPIGLWANIALAFGILMISFVIGKGRIAS